MTFELEFVVHQKSLKNWIIHRAKSVRLSWPHGVADAAGIPPAMLNSVSVTGNLRHVGRSSRSYIARVLKVSVRELEALDAGRIDWIADEHIVDFDRMSINAARVAMPETPVAVSCLKRRGVPILGRILPCGKVEHSGDWSPEDGPRLPIRYTGVPDAFALTLAVDLPPHRSGTRLIFQVIPPGELLDGELALLTHGDRDIESELCIVRRQGHLLFRTSAGLGNAPCVLVGEIPRAARVIGHYGMEPAGIPGASDEPGR